MSLEQMMQTGLPMNRKERFFTGTVLPMIVCADNFSRFDRFTDLIPDCAPPPAVWDPVSANVQFFTEYSFVESVYGPARARFPVPPATKDTPDLMVLIAGATTELIAVEAKMFHNPVREELDRQLAAQGLILEYLQRELRLDRVHHVALLPEKLARAVGALIRPTITWEQLYGAFMRDRQEDYFLAMLRIAIESYDALVSVSQMGTFGRNSERKVSGAEIVRLARAGRGPAVMGRNGGLHGPTLTEDVATGRWRTQMYETRAAGDPPNRNWFHVEDFMALIEETDL